MWSVALVSMIQFGDLKGIGLVTFAEKIEWDMLRRYQKGLPKKLLEKWVWKVDAPEALRGLSTVAAWWPGASL